MTLEQLKASLARNRKLLARRIALNQKTRKRIALRKRQIKGFEGLDKGSFALRFAVADVGKHEDAGRPNRAKWLDGWVAIFGEKWMTAQPWCGLGVWMWYHRAGLDLPKDTVSTIAIAARARRGDKFTVVPADKVKAGDLLVMHLGSGGPKHVGLARGPMKNGVFQTVEGNTSAGNSGSQADGGGILSLIHI